MRKTFIIIFSFGFFLSFSQNTYELRKDEVKRRIRGLKFVNRMVDSLNSYSCNNCKELPRFFYETNFDRKNSWIMSTSLHSYISLRKLIIDKIVNKKLLYAVLRSKDKRLRKSTKIPKKSYLGHINTPFQEYSTYSLVKFRLQELWNEDNIGMSASNYPKEIYYSPDTIKKVYLFDKTLLHNIDNYMNENHFYDDKIGENKKVITVFLSKEISSNNSNYYISSIDVMSYIYFSPISFYTDFKRRPILIYSVKDGVKPPENYSKEFVNYIKDFVYDDMLLDSVTLNKDSSYFKNNFKFISTGPIWYIKKKEVIKNKKIDLIKEKFLSYKR
ncbi:MAG: hypothetical protein QM486_05275 [Flavobacteriaceae bacterium]